MSLIISPSILSANFSKMEQEIKALEETKAEYIHLDVMDGQFVPTITFGPQFIAAIRPFSKKIFDVHLMIEHPENHIEAFAKAGADIITIHVESTIHLHRVINQIKSYGKKVGVALNPSTPLESIRWVLQEVDMVLLMTVNPGFGGQHFIPAMVDKINTLHKLAPHIKIQVDGGINVETARQCYHAGASILVAGSYIFSKNYAEKINSLLAIEGSL